MAALAAWEEKVVKGVTVTVRSRLAKVAPAAKVARGEAKGAKRRSPVMAAKAGWVALAVMADSVRMARPEEPVGRGVQAERVSPTEIRDPAVMVAPEDPRGLEKALKTGPRGPRAPQAPRSRFLG